MSSESRPKINHCANCRDRKKNHACNCHKASMKPKLAFYQNVYSLK